MHPIEEKIAKSFHFVKRDIEQLQKAYLASDKTQVKVLDTIATQDKLIKRLAVVADDLVVRVTSFEKTASKQKSEAKQNLKKENAQIADLKKALAQSQKLAKKQEKDIARLTAKLEKLSAVKKAPVKKASKK